MNRGSQKHEDELKNVIKIYEKEGWRVVDLKGKSPDAIATKDDRLIAIEVLGMDKIKSHSYTHNWTYKGKKTLYERLGFDELKIHTFEKEKWRK